MTTNQTRKPKWLKIKLSLNDNYNDISNIISKNKLNTVCSEARCPNIYECWNNRTATIMILGDTCTRACGFCSVKTGKPNQVDTLEPVRVAEAAKKMDLRHIVITSVDRDDLRDDYGADIWAATINRLHSVVPNCSVEVLTPDFRAYEPSLKKVFNANPSIFSHNIECVQRISRQVRKQSRWSRSKKVLELSVENNMLTKTGLMVGLGETNNEVIESMKEMANIGVEIFNIGQYLQPTKKHLEVQRYVHPDEFKMFKEIGLDLGFKVVESGPLVRSSYHADKQAKLYRKQPNVAS
ncbi:MAG: lipoyl synthase [bacterium TMED6]|nr:MAG: lipoyl synthase [bacterium TMED6]|tara:strand:+ start:25045 stop:25929 length:885 start_codon:yes stop_codon:yes gene_type:complete